MMKLRTYQSLLFMLLITACDKEDEIIKKKEFYPLSVGNEWKYEVNNTKNGINSDEYILSIVKDTSINIQSQDFDAFVVESYRVSNPNDKWNVFWGHDFEGNLIQLGVSVQAKSLIDKSIQYKKNVVVGDFWNYNHLVYSESDESRDIKVESFEIECVQLDTLITTKAGKFRCIKYYDKFMRWENEDEKRFYYVNPDIGLVKFTLLYNGEIESEMTLTEYYLK